MTVGLVVSVGDVSPATATATDVWLAALERRGIPASLLVVPGAWRGDSLADRPTYQAFLRERRAAGDEIVQLGWRHAAGADACGWRSVTRRPLDRGAGEFAALSAPAARLRLHAGQAILADAGLATDAFTAPGWLHSPGTVAALRELGYRYTTTRTAVVPLAAGAPPVRGVALAHRSAAGGERASGALLRFGARAAVRSGSLVRIALHPDDLRRGDRAGVALAAIDEAIAVGARPMTYRQALLAGSAPAT